MKQPPGFVDPNHFSHVFLLHKSINSLKQALRAWFHGLTQALQLIGFQGSKTDPSLFIYSHADITLYMLIYVGDIILTCNNTVSIDKVIKQLEATLAIKDLGTLSYFLVLEIVP